MSGRRGDVLALLAGESPEAPIGYARVSADGAEIAEEGTLAAASRGGAPAVKASRTVLILPASLGRLTLAALPARTDAQARAAAPFLLEESLAAGAQTLHYAVGEAQNEAGQRLIAAIDKQVLERFLARCRGHGADPHIVLFDCAALRPLPGEAKALETADRLILGADEQGGVSLEPGLALALAPRWLQSLGQPLKTVAYRGGDAGPLRRALEGVAAVRADGPGSAAQILARDALEASAAIPNLRQGAFAPSGERGAARSGNAWRIAAIFGAAAILAQAAAQGVSGWRDRQTAAGVETDARAQFRAMAPAFPEGGDVLAAVRALAAGAQRAEAHPVLRVSPSLTEALKAEPRVRLDSLVHRPGEKGVEVTLSTTAPEALPILIAALRAKRLTITEAPPASGPIRVTQTLKVEPAP